MKLRLTRMGAGLAIGTALAVLISCSLGTYLYSRRHYQTLLNTARATALSQSDLIRVALEHQMLENDRSLIDRMIQSFGKQPGVAAVVLLDRQGQTRYSSIALEGRDDLLPGSPTCLACHRYPPEQRTSSRVIETSGGQILRTVVPIRNREACYACHDPSRRINGVLIVDVDAGAIHTAMFRDLRWMAVGSGAIMLVLVGTIGLLVRIFVMRRLERFETTARKIAAGELDQRVPVDGTDTVDWLAREFNSMADSMANLLQDVHAERERLEKVINSIDDGIVVLDTSRNVVAANDAFLRRTDGRREAILGSSCGCAAANICGLADCPTLACLHTGDHQVRICERKTTTGAAVWEEVHTSPILGPSGTIVQVVEVWRDISKRRSAEAQLAESHRLASLGLLASGFSHELNTPLATILTCVEGIQRTLRQEKGNGDADRERIAESAQIAREQLLRCRGITQHFLRLSRGKQSEAAVVDLGATIAAVIPLISPTAHDHSVEIVVETVAPGLNVRVNEPELQQVILNIILNAIQASKPQGTVRLTVEATDRIRIRVIDEGCGIAPSEQKNIFEPFFGLREGGTGLGLFLSLDFVRRWGGDITVQSAVGEGSTFEISLPTVLRDVWRPGAI